MVKICLIMPQKHKPKRLEEIALVAVGNWFKLFGQYLIESKAMADSLDLQRDPIEMEVQLAEVRETLFATVPCCLFDEVAEQVLIAVKKLSDEHHSGYVALLSEVAMHPRIKQISVTRWPKSMQYILLKNLQSMIKLTTFHAPYSTTDAVVHALGSNCPALQELDIRFSSSVTDCGLSALFNCKNLRKVHLEGTLVTSTGIKDLLLNLPDIKSVGYHYDFVSVLEQLHGHISKPLSLVALNTGNMTSEQLKLLIHYCPSLKSLLLMPIKRNFHHTGDLSILKELKNLQELTLHSCDFSSHCVKQLLEYKGCNFDLLHLIDVINIDLMYISQYCPNLKDIMFCGCEFADLDLIHFGHKKLAVPSFTYLKRLVWILCSQVHLEFLMTRCKNVKYIEVETIGDAMMSRVMAQNQMKSLEELIIMYPTDLSMQSVQLLMTHCDQLRAISDLERWEGISSSELADFRVYIHSNNVNLTID